MDYKSRFAIKRQALADFIIEFPPDLEKSRAIVIYEPP